MNSFSGHFRALGSGRVIPALAEGADRVEWKQVGNLCGGLRWARWDAVLGARDRGEGIAGGRARDVFVLAGERDLVHLYIDPAPGSLA